jgi:tRNA threonylcarbamoyladenosine modification (KEOPS) complex  Pcc1 subunit
MEIKAKISISGENSDIIANSLMPDNMNNMDTIIDKKDEEKNENCIITYIKADKIGSLIASVDDYLMNTKLAKDILEILGIEGIKRG